MESRVVFLHYHGIGHLNPCFPLARILQRHRHEVTFAGVTHFQQYVKTEGFSFYPLTSVPFGLGFETWINKIEKRKNIYWSTLKDRITDRLYTMRMKELSQMLSDLSPDIILLDATQATDFIVLFPLLKGTSIKIAMLHAMFPTQVLTGRPPVNSSAFPEDIPAVKKAMHKFRFDGIKKKWKQKLRYLTFDDQYIVDRRLRKNQVPALYRSKISSLFYYNPYGLLEFVLSPREFDFPDFEADPHQHYIGFMQNPFKTEGIDAAYASTREQIISRKRAQDLRVVYCSFGTIETDHKRIIHDFFKRLIQVSKERKFLLIISTGSKDVKVEDLPSSDGVYFFQSVPQIDVLGFSDLFITHGGLSSIKESIHAGVPMLMYPVHADFDPMGNAARVAYHGLGLRGNAASDSSSVIWDKIEEVFTNPTFRDNVRRMNAMNEKYTEGHFLNLFKKIQPVVA
jgi:zeaxanthin glucosyltransferase